MPKSNDIFFDIFLAILIIFIWVGVIGIIETLMHHIVGDNFMINLIIYICITVLGISVFYISSSKHKQNLHTTSFT
jgi:hypothetical protein